MNPSARRNAWLALAAFTAGCDLARYVTDADGDGYTAAKDCDDGDPSIHAGAEEVCDGVDQDCDGRVDEQAVDQRTFWLDSDGDGYGFIASPVRACTITPSWGPLRRRVRATRCPELVTWTAMAWTICSSARATPAAPPAGRGAPT